MTKTTSTQQFIFELLSLLVKQGGSDLFISTGFPPAIKLDGCITPVGKQALTEQQTASIAYCIMNERQRNEFDTHKECNFAISPDHHERFRVNVFTQQETISLVLRTIPSHIATLEDLKMPTILQDISMNKRGLVILVGGTGTGKSTTLAAMLDYRNENSYGHIITIEDPIEFVHHHKNCIVSQREVGVDTESWEIALKNTLRQAPDVIMMGEIRDRQTMEHAIAFSETGHLCFATLHANNANQALDRIINFFSEERKQQVLMDLSLNLSAIVSQRLVRKIDNVGRSAAIEILLNSPLISDLIFKGNIPEIKEVMKRSTELGMQTFDQALFQLYEQSNISYEEALRNADSFNDLRLAIKLKSKHPPTETSSNNLNIV